MKNLLLYIALFLLSLALFIWVQGKLLEVDGYKKEIYALEIDIILREKLIDELMIRLVECNDADN